MKAVVSLLVTCLFTVSALADSAKAKYDEAKALYTDRGDSAKLDRAIADLEQAEALSGDQKDLKYDVLVLASQSLYFKGLHTAGEAARLAIFDKAQKKADAAKKLMPDLADAYFWYAANLARWAETKGVIASLQKKNELMRNLEKLEDPDMKSHDGGPAEAFEYYGGSRILGRVYFKLPGFAGGSQAKSLQYLQNAYDNAKNDSLNVLYYAETLWAGSSADKQKARNILDEMLRNDPKTYNPNRVPETIEEFVDARKLRAQMGK
jgi:hypothetical protein